MISVSVYVCVQESYVSYADHLRLTGEIISFIGAIIILLLEVHIQIPETHFHNKNCFNYAVIAQNTLLHTDLDSKTFSMFFSNTVLVSLIITVITLMHVMFLILLRYRIS